MECLETGVYLSDIIYTFEAVDELIWIIDQDLAFGFNQIALLMMPDVSYNRKESECKRKMNWIWRGDYSPSNKAIQNDILQYC